MILEKIRRHMWMAPTVLKETNRTKPILLSKVGVIQVSKTQIKPTGRPMDLISFLEWDLDLSKEVLWAYAAYVQ